MKQEHLEIPIDEFSSPILSFATEETSIEEMVSSMEDMGFRHLPVLRDNKPVGIISRSEVMLLSNLNKHFDLKAKDIMVEDPYCVPRGTSIEDVAFEMSTRKIGSAIILDENGGADSIFTSIDGLNAIVEIVRGELDI